MRPGDYIRTPSHEKAVCVDIEGEYVYYRYEAVHCVDDTTIWPMNGDLVENVEFLCSEDETSRTVLLLKGAYGEE